MTHQASELAQTFLARQQHVAGEGQDQQRLHYDTAFGLAEVALDSLMEKAPDLITPVHISSSSRIPDAYNRMLLRTPFKESPTGIWVASGKVVHVPDLTVREVAQCLGTFEEEVDYQLQDYQLLFRINEGNHIEGELGKPYAKMPWMGKSVIKHAMGDSVVHSNGYNEAADLEVIDFLRAVRDGVDADIAKRSVTASEATGS